MNENLPQFRYHPSPIDTGMVVGSDRACVCCMRQRGLIYGGPTYAAQNYAESFCPWCIADGSAAEKFNASFADERPLRLAAVSEQAVITVTTRTPGYNSWQTDEWLCHCGDAAAYYGDASAIEVASLSTAEKSRFLERYVLDQDEWEEIRQDYRQGGDPGIYRFQCLHCGEVLFGMDCT